MLDGISNALVLFPDPIFLTFYANWRTGRSKRSSNKAAGKSNAQAYTLGFVEELVEAENAVGDRFQRPARRRWWRQS
jgi:hypothetical protein